MHALRRSEFAFTILLFAGSASLRAQQGPRLDLAVTYSAQRSLKAATGENFWMQGGSVQLGADAWKGWGIVVDVMGTHANSIGSSGIPLSLAVATFGPRYRWRTKRKMSLYGQALVGEANGFSSLFPTRFGTQPSANSLAIQLGGGVDYRFRGRFAVRVLDAAWLRTQLPNATDNLQNTLRVGAGAVIRFGR